MANDTKNAVQTPKEKLISEAKQSGYKFNKKAFEEFQNFFSKEFSNVNLEEIRKQAWRTR